MRIVRMTVAYVGTGFAGWQVQPGRPTIQGLLEDELSRMLREQVRVAGAGRTDAGVHALGQVANFTTERLLPLTGLRRGLNARLPETIRILEATEAEPGFHARTDARLKEYRYCISRAEVVSPFRAPFVLPVHGPLDPAAMRDAAARFIGSHDFTSFAPADCALEDRVRRVTSASVEVKGEEIEFTVRASGFLRHMVRTMAGTLLAVGRGQIQPGEIDRILAARDRRAAGPRAAARGLTLMRVYYGEEQP